MSELAALSSLIAMVLILFTIPFIWSVFKRLGAWLVDMVCDTIESLTGR